MNEQTNRVFTTNAYEGEQAGHSVSIIDGATHTVVKVVEVGSNPWGVATNPGMNRIYVANKFGAPVSVIDGNTENVVATIPLGQQPTGVAVNSVTNRIYVISTTERWGWVIDGNSETVIGTIRTDGGSGLVVDPQANRIYAVRLNRVTIIDGATDAVVGEIKLPFGAQAGAVDPATSRLYVTQTMDYKVTVIDTTSEAVIDKIWTGGGPSGIAVNPPIKRVYVANSWFPTPTLSVFLEDEFLRNASFDGESDPSGVPDG